MINVEDALKAALRDIKALAPETVRLTDSLGRILSEDIPAGSNVPAFDNSAMDGYAVRYSDTAGSSKDKPKVLEVVENIKAGDVPRNAIRKGEAARIMTGAMVPKGADSVVMVENTRKTEDIRRDAERVKIFAAAKRGENIRKAGEDIKRGEIILRKGAVLRSAHIGILASLGIPRVEVVRKPKVAILVTGDEVIGVEQKLTPGKLHNSNTYTLYGQVINCGGLPKNLGIARDRPDKLETKIREGLGCDIILTSGGVSVGDYDLVKFILAKMGTNIKFWQVAMRPGKPLVFGNIKGIPIFGLPGNPVSSMISFEVFVRPAILKMLGMEGNPGKEVDAVLEEDIKKKKGLVYFLRAETRWEDGVYLTRTTGPQGSGVLKSMALANSLIILSEKEEFAEKGTRVTVRFLD